jgi:putative transposase
MKKSRFTEEQMVAILREADQAPVPEVAKKHKVSAQATPCNDVGGNAMKERHSELTATGMKRFMPTFLLDRGIRRHHQSVWRLFLREECHLPKGTV